MQIMFHTSVHSIQVVLPRIIINIIIICASSLYFADNNQSVKTMQNNQNEGNRVCHKHSYSLIRFVLNNNKNIDSVDAFSDDIGKEYKRSKKPNSILKAISLILPNINHTDDTFRLSPSMPSIKTKRQCLKKASDRILFNFSFYNSTIFDYLYHIVRQKYWGV